MAKAPDSTLITSAGRSRSLDLEERQRRYLITMGVRTACFLLFLVVPGWWKLAALAGAALLPAFAVLFANSTDHRPPAVAPEMKEQEGLRALPASHVVTGTVEETE
ncbi:DUF3099 domain-containing protein [Tessaracoccus flavus]|uniref:Uncharacterized protein n=1 Tax=Tessaracoccus flavus TaxID=1610493 RepID=A0A1Q2CIZ1_9ACTN|nr:DUF3099 domain-containing protein [Tessaracoccus flavus]AQP46015.1 hypothetical protein RPIT_04425 [Tessaracoccus flavus]SDY36684.1 Protein of unknown function [Tessaracoccus flavus]